MPAEEARIPAMHSSKQLEHQQPSISQLPASSHASHQYTMYGQGMLGSSLCASGTLKELTAGCGSQGFHCECAQDRTLSSYVPHCPLTGPSWLPLQDPNHP